MSEEGPALPAPGEDRSLSLDEVRGIVSEVTARKLGWLDIKLLLLRPRQTIILSAIGTEVLARMRGKVRP